jgi:hypothetical protein
MQTRQFSSLQLSSVAAAEVPLVTPELRIKQSAS